MTDTPAVENTSNARFNPIALLSRFQIKALVVALLATIAGAGGMGWSFVDRQSDVKQVESLPDDARSMVDSGPMPQKPAEDDWSHWLGSKGVRIGLSFLGGFIIGFAFRSFLKTMALITAAAVTIFALLSYFQIINIDFSGVEKEWNSAREWITTQADKLKDVLWQYLPSSTTGFAGLFVGMKRK